MILRTERNLVIAFVREATHVKAEGVEAVEIVGVRAAARRGKAIKQVVCSNKRENRNGFMDNWPKNNDLLTL